MIFWRAVRYTISKLKVPKKKTGPIGKERKEEDTTEFYHTLQKKQTKERKD